MTLTDKSCEPAAALRTVFALLLQDRALEPVDPSSLPWDRPLFVIRSAPLPRLVAFMEEAARQHQAPVLHVMSHARDEAAIREAAPCPFTFHAYPGEGRYSLDAMPDAVLEQLRAVGFGALFFLDTGTRGDLLEEVERLLAAIVENGVVSFNAEGAFARTRDWRTRQLAEAAFLPLVEWYHRKLDPAGLK